MSGVGSDGGPGVAPAVASARARAEAFDAGERFTGADPVDPRARRRWPWVVGAVVAGVVVALGVVVVTGRPLADRPSLAHLRYLQAGLDESIEQRHLDGVSTHLDLWAGRVVVDLTGQGCDPPVGFGPDHPVTLEDWALIERAPELPPCNLDI